MAYDYRINAQAPTQGISPFQAGRQMGGGFGKLSREIVGGYREGQQQEQDAVKKQKIDALVMKYNNPNSPEFQGLDGKQRALKLSRLLYPLDEAMASRYEQQARSVEEKSSLFEQQEKLKRIGLKSDAKNKFNAKLGSLFRNIQDKESWDAERERWKGQTDLFIPDWESPTRTAWIEDAIKAGTKTEKKTEVKSSDLAREGASAFDAGKYADWHSKNIAGTGAESYMPDPTSGSSVISKSLQSLKEGKLGGATFSSKVTQSNEAGAEANVGLDQLKIDSGTKFYEGIPSRLDGYVKALDDKYEAQTQEAISASEKAKRILSVLGDTKSNVKGASAVTAVFDFLKALDPRSVVREGEFAMIEQIGGLKGRISTAGDQLDSGVTIPAEVVADMKRVLEIIKNEAELKVKSVAKDTANKLIDKRIDPKEVLPSSVYANLLKGDALNSVGKTTRTRKELGY